VEELQRGLAALVHLESLQLRLVHGVGIVLEALLSGHPSPPLLTRLLIELPAECNSPLWIPQPAQLSSLVKQAGALHITLVLDERMRCSTAAADCTSQERRAVTQSIADLRRAAAAAGCPRMRIVPPSTEPDVWNG
jgi:hypothetical protein